MIDFIAFVFTSKQFLDLPEIFRTRDLGISNIIKICNAEFFEVLQMCPNEFSTSSLMLWLHQFRIPKSDFFSDCFEYKSRVFLLRQLRIVNYYVKKSQ